MLATLIFAMATNPLAKATITVQAGKPGIRISPDLYGIFFEEVNCAGDGGLYAEMVRNRSFEDAEQPAHWSLVERPRSIGTPADEPPKGEMTLDKTQSISRENPTSLKLTFAEGAGFVGASNEGYWGIPVSKGESYSFSCHARSDGSPHDLLVTLEGKDGKPYAKSTLRVDSPYWIDFSRTLTASGDDPDARLVISLDKPGTVWLDMVSLFPATTFKNRPNGLRVDLAEKLTGLRPSFMRFPGGCWVEGDTLAFSQQWKRTVGPLQDRWTQYDLWQYTSTNGLGFHEYLQLCEDTGAAPLFVINCGMSHHGNVPMSEMDSRVQDALDAIEYANGPVTSQWGALRAKNGHPKPFGLKYLEIGNENGGPAYRERYPLIAKAVKAKYPEIKLIANVWGGYPKGTLTEIIDEHYYSNPGFFFENADRYDKYDRKGPKVYVGEYAVTEGCGAGNLIAAVSEAAFMTGMERNSDVVEMSSYAPLFANVNHKTWNPDMICFDNHRSYGTPSYYVQQMFSANRGDHVLPASVDVSGVEKPTFAPGGIGVGTWGTQAEFKDIKILASEPVILRREPSNARLAAKDPGFDAPSSAIPPLRSGGGWPLAREGSG
ncbi:MAG: alpha-L-arabinofuranosidase C-terminal domain-containing protein, partial [Fimbriimonadales bacterium]